MLKKILVFALFLLILGSLILAVACEPGGRVTIENQGNQEVTMYISTVRDDGTTDGLTPQGSIPANSKKEFALVFPSSKWVNRITLKNTLGNIVFVHDYTMADLEKINWTITIPE